MTDSSDNGIERDDLGRRGESWFEDWCSALRWIAQRSTCDRRGFDFLVHIPAAAINDDLKEDVVARKEHLVAVQIKSTGCGKMPGLSLTNLRHLVEHPGPSLVVLMEIDLNASPWRVSQARLLHLDQKWVEEAVRHIWTLEVGIALGKSSLTLSSADMLVLDSPDAASFRSALQKLNISDPDTYIRNKEDQRQKAGRPENPLTGNFTVNLTDPRIEEVIEWSVGLRSSAEIPVERSGAVQFRA